MTEGKINKKVRIFSSFVFFITLFPLKAKKKRGEASSPLSQKLFY
jgi:hypothetical protein